MSTATRPNGTASPLRAPSLNGLDRSHRLPASNLRQIPITHRPSEPEQTTRDRVHECFSSVAMGLSSTLSMLLEATRAAGLDDNDVRDVLSTDETAVSTSGRECFRCYRTPAGQLYIATDSGIDTPLASSHELFRDVRDSEQFDKAGFVFGKQCVYCNTSKAKVVDHRIPRSQGGLDDVSNYAPACHNCDLTKAGRTPEQWAADILGAVSECRNVPVSGCADSPAPEQFPKAFDLAQLYPHVTETQRIVLSVARTMTHKFGRGCTAGRRIVTRLCYRYHSITKSQVVRAIDGLKASGILSEAKHGRLQLRASAVDWLAAQDSTIAVDDQNGLADLLNQANQTYGKSFSPMTCRFIAMVWQSASLDHIPLVELFRFCKSHAMTEPEIRGSIGELHAREHAFIEWCENSEAYVLSLENLDSPRRSLSDLLEAMDDVQAELQTA